MNHEKGKKPEIKTFGDLKKSGYQTRPIRDELRENLILRMKADTPSFQGVWAMRTR